MTTPREQDTASAEETMLELDPEQLGVEAAESAGEQEADHLRALVEAIVYVLEEPMSAAQIAQVLNRPKETVQAALDALVADAALPNRGVAVREVAGGYKMSTKPEFHDEIRGFVKRLKPPLKLSLAALETLAVIAYKQPITSPEIQEIRGVQGAGVLKTLLERKLITAAGRKQVVGRPVLYKTTKDFLVQFGLKDLAELPTLKEFEEWSRLALGDTEDDTPEQQSLPGAQDSAGGQSEPDPSAENDQSETLSPEASGDPDPDTTQSQPVSHEAASDEAASNEATSSDAEPLSAPDASAAQQPPSADADSDADSGAPNA